MRTCDGVCQNHCRMEALCTVGCCSNTGWEDRAFVFIRYLHPNETQPEMRKRLTKWADLYEAKAREPSRTSSILGSPLLQKRKFAPCGLASNETPDNLLFNYSNGNGIIALS